MNDDQQPNNLVVLQADYLEALRLGSGRAADQVVQQALDSGADAGDVYLDIFQPTAYEIGRLWQLNRFTVAQEHLATAIIERQMGELHPLFRPRHRRPQVLVIGCVLMSSIGLGHAWWPTSLKQTVGQRTTWGQQHRSTPL